MNYRHAFHAGNFADLLKHAVLLAVLERLTRNPAPLAVIDTHAGAGLYGLQAEAAQRSGEAQAGVARLMQAEPAPGLEALAAQVARLNGGGVVRVYPGSPLLALAALRPGDSYCGCELRPDDHAILARVLRDHDRRGVRADALLADGYEEAASRLHRGDRTLLLVDPPFEAADDYARAAALVAARAKPRLQPMLIWTPLKDLETFDAFVSRLEAGRPASLAVVELRLRPLDDPMRLNGCALVLVDAPDVSASALRAAGWIAQTLGAEGARARVERLAGAAT